MSLKVKDMHGFIYGPFATRFWMMRMGMNELIIDNTFKVKRSDSVVSDQSKDSKGSKRSRSSLHKKK